MAKKSDGNKKQSVSKLTILRRLFFCFASLLLATTFSFLISDRLINWLQVPLGQSLFYNTSSNLSGVTLITSVTFGLILTLPIITYQATRLFEGFTGLNTRPLTCALLSALFAGLGIIIARYIALPAALSVFTEMNNGALISDLVSINGYFMFISAYLGVGALLCQAPIAIVVANRSLKLNVRQLLHLEGYVLLVSLVPAAILTPTSSATVQIPAAILITFPYLIGAVWIALNKEQIAIKPAKLLDPFNLPIPDAALDAALSTDSPISFKPNQYAINEASVEQLIKPAASVKMTSNPAISLSRYKGVGYARQPVSYKARPRRALISDFTVD